MLWMASASASARTRTACTPMIWCTRRHALPSQHTNESQHASWSAQGSAPSSASGGSCRTCWLRPARGARCSQTFIEAVNRRGIGCAPLFALLLLTRLTASHSRAMSTTDLYGFEIKTLSVHQQQDRLLCDSAAEKQVGCGIDLHGDVPHQCLPPQAPTRHKRPRAQPHARAAHRRRYGRRSSRSRSCPRRPS